MNKRKNDDPNAIPLWLWVVIPVVLVAVGGAGVLLGQYLAKRDSNTVSDADMTATQYVVNATASAEYMMTRDASTATASATWIPTVTPVATLTFTPAPNFLTVTPFADIFPTQSPELDVTFLIDTTSSMGDEIAQLQNNILYIAGEVDKLNADARYGLVLYREWDNYQYVYELHDFTSDVTEFQNTLSQVTADSGDNNMEWDEALNEGFYHAVHDMSWRGDNTIKLMFLVGDASAHINHPREKHQYPEIMFDAAAKGIKIHTVASSGLDPQGEYQFRQISEATMGHFIFLTYDTSAPVQPAPGNNRPDLNVGDPKDVQGAGEYTVEQLDDIVLRLIVDELSAPLKRD